MATTEFIAAGSNHHASAADWKDGSLAYGSGINVALARGTVKKLLKGHTDTVTAVRIGKDIVSGSADGTIRIWRDEKLYKTFEQKGAVNTISLHEDLIISGSADATIRIWQNELKQTVQLQPRFLPLATAITQLDDTQILAVAGTATFIQLYISTGGDFTLAATLTGHEGWIRSLDFSGTTLASASQDKFIRLWKFSKDQSTLSNKAHKVGDWSVQYDALLVGHEDWIYTVRWKDDQLLSASADNSLAIWKFQSGIWICDVRLGDLSSLKGATTATGSTGGFFIGLWTEGVIALGRTGSWRCWGQWEQQVGISGHTKEVQALAWSKDGSYLLSTSLDQTTRLWANKDGWHEYARPQIHGYDLQCIATLPKQFVSGAEEKLLRVFNEPEDPLSGKVASLPVLGLSNKASTEEQEQLDHPPFEEHLSRFTLWPEHEKLYGHGYEISAVAANSGNLIATSCKASSPDHAVIRLYETKTWREVQALTAHSLTVSALAFSPDDRYLLSVGRDRQLAIFDGNNNFALVTAKQAHARMVNDCVWLSNTTFATAGRNKQVKIWNLEEEITTIKTPNAITALAYQAGRLAIGDETGQASLLEEGKWDIIDIDNELCPSKAITSLAWRPGSDLLAIASEDHSIRLLNV